MSQHDVQIANTILAQLGGNKFRAMTDSRDFGVVPNGLQFKVGRNGNGINFCVVRLNGTDTYDVEYGFLRSGKFSVKSRSEGVYADQLQQDFTSATGLHTTLGTLGPIKLRG